MNDFTENDPELQKAWEAAEAATGFTPLPTGEYIAGAERGERTTAPKGTPGYKLTFRVCEGEHTGRLIFNDLWLTPAGLPYTKRDLAKLNITDFAQLRQPLPRGYVCKVKVTIHTDDSGKEFNRVKSFEVIRFDPPEADPFAPAPDEPVLPVSAPATHTESTSDIERLRALVAARQAMTKEAANAE